MIKLLRLAFFMPFILFSFLVMLYNAWKKRNTSDFISLLNVESGNFMDEWLYLRSHISWISWILLLTYLIY